MHVMNNAAMPSANLGIGSRLVHGAALSNNWSARHLGITGFRLCRIDDVVTSLIIFGQGWKECRHPIKNEPTSPPRKRPPVMPRASFV